MRICFLTTEYASRTPTGGIANYVRDTAVALTKQGHQVTVVCGLPDGVAYDETDQGVQVHYVPGKKLPVRPLFYILSFLPGLHFFREIRCGWSLVEVSLAVWLKVAQINRQGDRIDLIDAPDFSGIAFWGFLQPFRQTPILIRGHSFLDLRKKQSKWCGINLQHFLETFCLRRADFVLANSEYLQQRYICELGLSPHRLGNLATAFDLSLSDKSKDDYRLRQERGWEKSDVVALFVGRIEYQKGCDLLFEAAIHCHKQIPHFRLVLLGRVTDAFMADYKAFMSQAAGWVCHPGAVPAREVAEWMSASDMLVLPSRAETFGRVVAEAHLLNLPTIVTAVDALPENVIHGVNGLLVQVDDPQSLAEAILKLCHDPEPRTAMGKQARARAEIKFAPTRIFTKQVELYQAIAEGRDPIQVLNG